MFKMQLLPVLFVLLLAACNSAADKDKSENDSTVTDHGMHHVADHGAVPSLPAVPEGARVFFVNLKDGDIVTSPLKIEMGAASVKVDTAGPVLAGTGHHHLLVNAGDSVATGTVIPMDSSHIHFGRGQVQTEINLAPGKHRLTLQFADGLHRSYGSGMAASVTVEVKK